ncbi:hypothetical protein LTR37_007872 [Vermiconidia calcicola]|uniref:Uncharacterized protein n=1 Tax=Vermiconidia calcicola TaxID=1690605 RepID=A0ACC3NC80_9PEZI|nr:hypothetical protein LTR37_007872 [Vermiconidia calcicola]
MPRHDIEQRIRRFLSYHLTNNKSGYDLYFHLEGEPCEVRRPLSKLFTTFRPSWFNGRKVPVHWAKAGNSSAVPAKTKLAVRKASQQLPSTSLGKPREEYERAKGLPNVNRDARPRLGDIKTIKKEFDTALAILSTPSEQPDYEARAADQRGQEKKKMKAEEDAEPEPQPEPGERKKVVVANVAMDQASTSLTTQRSLKHCKSETGLQCDHRSLDHVPEPGETQADEPQALLHLSYFPGNFDTALTTDALWEDTTIEAPLSASLADLKDVVEQCLLDNLEEDFEFLSTIEDTEGLLVYSIGQLKSVVGQPPLALEGPEFGLESVSDFFADPGAPDRAINVRVDLDLAARFEESDFMRLRKGDSAHLRSELAPKLRANTQQPYRAVTDLKVMVSNKEDRIVERSSLSPDFDAWKYGYIRLGTISHTDLGETNNERCTIRSFDNSVRPNRGTDTVGADTDHTVNNMDMREGSISCTKTLLGYYFKDYTSVHPWLMLIEVQAWDFGDYCIGDPITCDQDHMFSEYDSYLSRYAGVQSMEEVQKRVQRHVLSGKGEPGSGIPFMPFYTHNSYDPAAYGLGVEGVSVHVVVRFVDKFTVLQKQSGKQPRLVLPWCAQYVFDQEEASYDITRITRLIVENLRRPPSNNAGDHSHDGTRINSHTLLFKEPLKNLWTLQLWAMAQPQHLKKLYKFPAGRPGNMGCLGQFLDPRKVRLGDDRLYMEAHIVSRVEKEEEDKFD